MEAINFTQAHDDGAATRDLDKAQVILVGVSRCGKTPTSLYLALQFGIRAANFPLTPDDFADRTLPARCCRFSERLFGLTIQPERLREIREERRPGSQYAALDNCRYEVREAEHLMQQKASRCSTRRRSRSRRSRRRSCIAPSSRATSTERRRRMTDDDERPRTRPLVRDADAADDRDGGVDSRTLRTPRALAARRRRRRRRAVRHDRRRPVVFGRRATRRASTRCSRAGVAPARIVAATGCARADRHASRSRGTRVQARLRRAAWCCRRSSARTSPTTACTRGTRGSSNASPTRACASILYHIPQVQRRRRCRSTSSRGSRRRIPASSPASRTAPATGRTRRRCSSACRTSRSLVGHEPHLPRLLRGGGAGTICGIANVYPDARARAARARRHAG